MNKKPQSVEVTLTAPAKIGGKWRKVTEKVSVSADELRQLVAAGAAPGENAPEFDVPLASDFDTAVEEHAVEIQKEADARVADAEKRLAEMEEIARNGLAKCTPEHSWAEWLAEWKGRAEAAEAKVAELEAQAKAEAKTGAEPDPAKDTPKADGKKPAAAKARD